MLETVEVVLALLAAVAGLALLSRKVPVPYPIMLILGGLILAFIPGLPRVQLHPELVFLIFLPPLLYPAAIFTPWRDFRANLRPITLLAVGLVLFTTVVVGYLAHYFIEGLPLAAAFVLGAIISPPDAIAATAIANKLGVPRRIVTVLEGESLLNDATALVALRFGVAAVLTGSFSMGAAAGKFVVVAIGGIAIGLIVGWLSALIQKRIDDPPIEITLSLLTPFAAYLPAERLGLSGVLAVVTTGLYHGWRLPEFTTYRSRLQAGPVWQMIEFLLNGFIFLLIGLELPSVLEALKGRSIPQLVWYAMLISAAVILIRILWVFPASYLPRLFLAKTRARDPYPAWQNVSIVAWTGMRGVVSLAAALALPLENQRGVPFPGRDLIIFLTFVVILATLVVQGLTLPLLIRWLGVKADTQAEEEERTARLKANQAALARLDELANSEGTNPETVNRLRVEYEDRIRQLEACWDEEEGRRRHLFSSDYENLLFDTLQVERRTLIALRNEGIINDHVLRRIQRDVDLAEARIGHPGANR
jgi:Na+/H+ antiporter